MSSPKQLPAKQFAEMLTQKLEILAREQKTQEKLDRYLQENDTSINNDALTESLNTQKALGDALREKLCMEEDDQAILDEHVSRVWSDQTPSRSPRHSPERRRLTHNYPRPYKQRKEKENMDSTFSVDSGNIHDFQENNDIVGASSVNSLSSHLPKSKSVPSDYADSLHKQDMHQGKLNNTLCLLT